MENWREWAVRAAEWGAPRVFAYISLGMCGRRDDEDRPDVDVEND
jgi:hypothetical protein